jgi:hypothetical protein
VGWEIGFDTNWGRDIGYGVPAICDYPGCDKKITRGLSYVCGGEPHGGERGCGLYFCEQHLIYHARLPRLCLRCHRRQKPFNPKPDSIEWVRFKLMDPSWALWRKQNKLLTKVIRAKVKEASR